MSGGFITGNSGWRRVFYINLPLGLPALVWRMLDVSARRVKARIDWPGIALLTATITAPWWWCGAVRVGWRGLAIAGWWRPYEGGMRDGGAVP